MPDSTAALSSLKNASGPEDSGVAGGVEPGGLLSPRVVAVSSAGGGSVLPELEEPEDILRALRGSRTSEEQIGGEEQIGEEEQMEGEEWAFGCKVCATA